MRAVVTGAAGFVGARLSAALLDAAWSVLGIDAFRDTYDPALKRAAVAGLEGRAGWALDAGELVRGDLEERLGDADVVFHLAARASARASWGDPFEDYVRDNVVATERVLRAAHAAAVGRVVLASSSSVYGAARVLPTPEDAPFAPRSPYGATKAGAEHLAEAYGAQGLDVVRLRYFTVYGAGQRPDMAVHRMVDAALTGCEVPVYGDGRQTRDLTHVGDAVAGTLAAARHGRAGAVYNLGGGTRVSVREILALVTEAAGAAPQVLPAPAQAGDVPDTAADTARAREELGFSPGWTLPAGLAEQVAWQRALVRSPARA